MRGAIVSTYDLVLRAVILKYIADASAKLIAKQREVLDETMNEGDRTNVSDPDDPKVRLGYALKTDPKKGRGVVTDVDELTVWMAGHHPDRVHDKTSIADHGAALRILAEHAPHLLHTETVIADWALSEVLTLTEQARQPCGPEGELDIPGVVYEPPKPGVVSVKVDESAPEVIGRLWREGRINLETGNLLALESS